MDSLLLQILDVSLQHPARSFSKFFSPIISRLDAHYIIFDNQPCMGLPDNAREAWDNGERKLWLDFPECGHTSIQLWRPRALSAYSQYFGEEYISFWAIRTDSDPVATAQEYSRTNWSKGTRDRHALISLDYFDSSCWEICCADSMSPTLRLVEEHLHGKPWANAVRFRSDDRKLAFRLAGLSHLVDDK